MPRSEAENQRLREQQRANILDAAMRVFARSGPSASMAEIAEAAGVSQGLAYRYFASKEEIYYALVARAMQGGLPEAEIARMTSGGPWERLEALLSRIVNARREHPEFFNCSTTCSVTTTPPLNCAIRCASVGCYLPVSCANSSSKDRRQARLRKATQTSLSSRFWPIWTA